MLIEPARVEDLKECADCFAAAFQKDPATTYFFPGAWETRKPLIHEFFGLLLAARIQLNEPALVVRKNHRILGVVHGYRTIRPCWPALLAQRWTAFESRQTGITERLKVYDTITDECAPLLPHYYLGALAVHPEAQGKGVGRQLVSAFCQLSESDPKSSGTSLDTGNPSNLLFYRKWNFKVVGEGQLDHQTTLYCLFRQKGSDT